MLPDKSVCSGCTQHQHDALSRRDFVSLATLSAVSIALTACGGSDDGGGGTTGPILPGVGVANFTLADFPALATAGSAVKVQNSPPVAMVRTSAGLIAYSLSCTHQGTTVNINSNSTLRCPNHGATFTAEGVWTGGQPTSNLVRLPVSLNTAGTVATVTLG
jgi:cytochrome b6-f complex iron-sulfur subunit